MTQSDREAYPKQTSDYLLNSYKWLKHGRFTENCTMCDNGGGGSKRQETKILLRRLKRDNPNIENSIFRSIHAVALDTMPGYKSEGVEHSFLERFNAMEAASDENE